MDSAASQTSTTLLRQVAGGLDPAAESRFYERYCRMARAVILASGIRVQDCDDIVQEAMLVAMQGLRDGRYDRDRAGFRAWFKGILWNKIAHARRAASRVVSPAASLPDTPDPSPTPADVFEAAFEAQWQAARLEETLDEIKREVEPTTWQAYDLVKRKSWRPKDVAKHLGTTRGAVDNAVKRIKDRLAEKLA